MLEIFFQEIIMLLYMVVVIPVSAILVTAYLYIEKLWEMLT